MNAKYLFQSLTVLLLIGLSSLAFADETQQEEAPWKRFGLNLGGSFNGYDSNVRLGVKGVGLNVDVEELLDLDMSTSSFAIDAFWRFTQNSRHRLDFNWFLLHRSGTNVLGRSIDIGDLHIPLGTTVHTRLDIDIYRVGYSYSFFQDDRMDLAVSGGAYILPIKFDIRAESLIIDESESESITAPLPVIGLRADFAISPKWFLRSRIDLFYLEIGNFRGAIADTRLALEYRAFKHVGFGVRAENFRVKVEAEGDDYPGVDFTGAFEFYSLGLMAYLTLHFGK